MKSMTSTYLLRAGAVALLLGAGVLAGRALATGVPSVSPLTFSGVVTDEAGKPYPTAIPVIVSFYAGLSASSAACAAATTQAEAGTGRFEVVLAADCAKAVHDSNDLWSELTVGPSKSVLPRSRVAAVPYALEAEVASSAGGGLKAQISDIGAVAAEASKRPAALEVWDAGGQRLGRLVEVDGDSLDIVTGSGLRVHVNASTGALMPQAAYAVLYLGNGCTQTPYLVKEETNLIGGIYATQDADFKTVYPYNNYASVASLPGEVGVMKLPGKAKISKPIFASRRYLWPNFKDPSNCAQTLDIGQPNTPYYWEAVVVTTTSLGWTALPKPPLELK